MVRHTALRIWAAVFLGGGACLLVVSVFPSGIGQTPTLMMAGVIWGTFFFGAGFLMNHLGLFLVNRLISEAGAWEVAGGYEAAQKTYGRAAALFDSFLISPMGRRKKTVLLLSKIARFYLARAGENRESEIYVISYLKRVPQDREAAEIWLQQMIGRKEVKEEYHSLAGAIGEAQADHLDVQKLLARLYLSAHRSDFQALQTYRRVMAGADKNGDAMAGDLARLFLDQRRMDEWALQVYLKALNGQKENQGLLQGIAACVRRVHQTGENQLLLQSARRHLQGMDEKVIEQMCEEFDPWMTRPPDAGVDRRGLFLRRSIKQFIGFIINSVKQSIRRGRDHTRQFMGLIQRFVQVKKVFKWVVSSVLIFVVIIFIVNTINHLVKTRTRITRISEPVDRAVTRQANDRFTIQVAAYQKSEYAKRVVRQLKKQNIDAFWTEAEGAKRIWYQVRISHFPDKQSARNYGEKLKSTGIIDDFYVSNYERNPD